MANKTDDIRSTLNGLIETLKDGEEGFRQSSEKLKDAMIATEFRTYAAECASFARELRSEVTRMGGTPETSGSISGSLHRGWTNLRAAVAGDSDQAILEEAERAEDSTVKNYRQAMTQNLPPEIRSTVDRQFREIQNTHFAVRSLRDEAKQTKTFTSSRGGD
jgi:uncharacterized protein (TIGR02284 family)